MHDRLIIAATIMMLQCVATSPDHIAQVGTKNNKLSLGFSSRNLLGSKVALNNARMARPAVEHASFNISL